MELLTRLQDDMKIAMKSGDKSRLSVIRMLISDVKIIDLAPKPITAEETVAAYGKKLRKTQEEFQKLGKTAEVEQLKYELGVSRATYRRRLPQTKRPSLSIAFWPKTASPKNNLGKPWGRS